MLFPHAASLRNTPKFFLFNIHSTHLSSIYNERRSQMFPVQAGTPRVRDRYPTRYSYGAHLGARLLLHGLRSNVFETYRVRAAHRGSLHESPYQVIRRVPSYV